MKVLILSCNNGEGHNSAGKAIMEQAEKRGAFCVMIDTLLFSSPKNSKLIKDIHIQSALHAPMLYKAGNGIAEKMSESKKPSICYYANSKYADRIDQFIKVNHFDTVVATHVFAAEALTYLRANRDTPFKSYFVVTDYSVTPFFQETNLDAYFIPHPLLLPNFIEKAPGKNYVATGIPVSEDKWTKENKQDARAALELPPDCPIAMIMTGSMGFGDIESLISDMKHIMPKNTLILALCGNNRKLKDSLSEKFSSLPNLRILGYTDQVSKYMDASDILISKPGGLSTTEAAVKEIPLVHISPIPGWEEDNVAFFTRLGLSCSGDNVKERAKNAARLLTDEEGRREMAARQRTEINKFAARDIVEYILSHA